MKAKVRFLIGTLSIILVTGLVYADQSGLRIPKEVTGQIAWMHMEELAGGGGIGSRIAGTAEELEAADYISDQFESMGYDVDRQVFSYVPNNEENQSQNIIATKLGKIDQTVIIGAHYDSVPSRTCDDGEVINVSSGAGDNASGVGVMLEAAKILAKYKTHGTIKFVAFGAEEVGLKGSFHYSSQMSDEEISNTVTMINLDSVAAGDFFYVYAGKDDNPGWARDLALKIGQRMGYDLRTSPGTSPYYAWGTAGDWSDHVSFRLLGIPIAYFEWMNWDEDPHGGIETKEFGWIMHECLDNLDFIEKLNAKKKVEMTAELVATLTFELSKTKLPKAQKGKIAKGNKYISISKRTGPPN